MKKQAMTPRKGGSVKVETGKASADKPAGSAATDTTKPVKEKGNADQA